MAATYSSPSPPATSPVGSGGGSTRTADWRSGGRSGAQAAPLARWSIASSRRRGHTPVECGSNAVQWRAVFLLPCVSVCPSVSGSGDCSDQRQFGWSGGWPQDSRGSIFIVLFCCFCCCSAMRGQACVKARERGEEEAERRRDRACVPNECAGPSVGTRRGCQGRPVRDGANWSTRPVVALSWRDEPGSASRRVSGQRARWQIMMFFSSTCHTTMLSLCKHAHHGRTDDTGTAQARAIREDH